MNLSKIISPKPRMASKTEETLEAQKQKVEVNLSFHLLQLLTLQENWHSEKEIKVTVFDRNDVMSLMAYLITEAISNPNLLKFNLLIFLCKVDFPWLSCREQITAHIESLESHMQFLSASLLRVQNKPTPNLFHSQRQNCTSFPVSRLCQSPQ